MSEKSFAVASISVAFVWGTFFYPPAPQDSNRVESTISTSAADGQSGERQGRELPSLGSAALRDAPVALNTSGPSRSAPDIHNASLQECAIGAAVTKICTPLHKLAGH